MTRTDTWTLLMVAIRAVALAVAANALVGVPMLLASWRDMDMGVARSGWLLAGASIVFLLLALTWLYADKLARLALARPQGEVFESTIEPREWLGLAIAAIGAWFLLVSLRDAAWWLAKLVWVSRDTVGPLGMDNGLDTLLPDAVSILIQAALALVFLLRGRGIAHLLHRLRYGPPPSQSADAA